MKELICLNGWKTNSCCGGNRQNFLHGVLVKSGASIIKEFNYPFEVYVEKGKLVITKSDEAHVYYINEFSQTEQEVKDLVAGCITSRLGDELKMKTITYEVTSPEDTFAMPIVSGETYAGDNFVSVFMPSLVLKGTGTTNTTGDFEYQIFSENIIFNENIPFDADTDNYFITIQYWVYV